MRKRWIILNCVVALAVVVTTILIVSTGSTYDIHTRHYPEDTSLKNISVSFDEGNILQLKEVGFADDGEILVTVQAVGKGHVNTKIHLKDNNMTVSSRFYVTITNTIFERKFDGLNFTGYRFVMWELLVILIAVEVMMIWLLIEERKQTGISDKRTAYGGIIIFNLALLGLSIFKVIVHKVTAFSVYIALLQEAGRDLLLILVPFILLLSFSLTVGKIVAIAKKNTDGNPVFGILFGAIWFVATLLGFALRKMYTDTSVTTPLIEAINSVIVYVLGYFECLLLSSAVGTVIARRSIVQKVWYTFPTACLKRFKSVFIHQFKRHMAILVPIAFFFLVI